MLQEGKQLDFDTRVRHYHTKVWIPSWYEDNFLSFYNQVLKMASPKKFFKATDYFKFKAGYPHEVTMENQKYLKERGCTRDKLSYREGVSIPKINISLFKSISKNLIGFTAPSEKNFIRDITIYDDSSHESLAFIYVINRKAQVIAAWSEPKKGRKYKARIPKNLFKTLKFERENSKVLSSGEDNKNL